MRKNINLCLDDVRDSLHDKRGEYQSAVELMADITKPIYGQKIIHERKTFVKCQIEKT